MRPEEIIIAPVVTEKSNDELQGGKYTFRVNKKATKIDIKNAVEKSSCKKTNNTVKNSPKTACPILKPDSFKTSCFLSISCIP